MRPSCYNCARKHLAQAHILMMEAAQGYPDHAWLAIGHMAEAAEEIRGVSVEMSDRIRAVRKTYENDRTNVPAIMALIAEVGALIPSLGRANPAYTGDHDRHGPRLVGTPVVHHAPPPSKDLPSAADWLDQANERVVRLKPTRERVIDPVADEAVADEAEARFRAMTTGDPLAVPPTQVAPAPAGGCGGCAENALYEGFARSQAPGDIRPIVVILTTLSNFHASYSLVSVILEQAHALVLVGYRVVLAVHRGCDTKELPPLPAEITLMPVMPLVTFENDVIRDEIVTAMHEAITRLLNAVLALQVPVTVIDHDLMFQASFVNVAKAIHTLPLTLHPPYIAWFHMAHSSVSQRPLVRDKDRIPLPAFWRCTLPSYHRLLVLNHSDVPNFREYYPDTPPPHIHTLLNPRDIRPHLRMTPTASMLTTRFGLHFADVVCVFPVSATRLADKGVDKALQVIGALKRIGLTVRMVIPLAHANGDPSLVTWIREHATAAGLTTTPDEEPPAPTQPTGSIVIDSVPAPVSMPKPGEPTDVIISSAVLPQTAAQGLDVETVRSLWGITNLFILPSVSEAGSLVLLEAALSGCLLVLNGSLPALHDYIPLNGAIWVPWGSIKGPGQVVDVDAVADRIWDRLQQTPDRIKRQVMARHSLEMYGMELHTLIHPDGARLARHRVGHMAEASEAAVTDHE